MYINAVNVFIAILAHSDDNAVLNEKIKDSRNSTNNRVNIGNILHYYQVT